MISMDVCSAQKTTKGIPIKKPWTVATTVDEIGLELSQYQCDESHDHVQGRGKPLKETESYSYLFTDCVHRAFDRAAQSARTFACALIAVSDLPVFAVMLDATSSSVSLPPPCDGSSSSWGTSSGRSARFGTCQLAPGCKLPGGADRSGVSLDDL